MGIYINGMEMPKGCYECPLMDGEYGNCKVGATGLYDPYMDDCPLTEVPEPHGRLIDGDKVVKDYHDYGIPHSYDAFDLADIIAESPTVIERSK